MASISWRLAVVGAVLICLASTASADMRGEKKVVEVAEYGQCGGKGGMCGSIPGATCAADAPFPGFKCTSGFTCSRGNEWYWQCLPGSAPVNPSKSPNPDHPTPPGTKVIDLWAQCGGMGGVCKDGSDFPCVDDQFPGYSCAAGSFCSAQSKWYRQCILSTTSVTPSASPAVSPSPSPNHTTPPGTKVIDLWAQCGGMGGVCKDGSDFPCVDAQFPGYSCAAGSYCSAQSKWYRQCIPSTTPVTTSPSPDKSPSPSPKPSVSPSPPDSMVVPIYGQCGGLGGSCKNNCVDGPFPGYSCEKGSTCQKGNPYYYQCLP